MRDMVTPRLTQSVRKLTVPTTLPQSFRGRFCIDFADARYCFWELAAPIGIKNESAMTPIAILDPFLPIFPRFRIYVVAMPPRLSRMVRKGARLRRPL